MSDKHYVNEKGDIACTGKKAQGGSLEKNSPYTSHPNQTNCPGCIKKSPYSTKPR